MKEDIIYMKDHDVVKEKAPLVSIIMPTYNVEPYLSDTLNGLEGQTLKDFEIIFVDDGSQDGTVAGLQEFAARFCRATVLQQKHQYAGAARNLGMRYACGKYFLFLDGDDFFLPHMLEKAVEKAERTGSDICVFRTNRIDHETKKISGMPWSMRNGKYPKEEVFSVKTNAKYIFEFTTAAPWNKLYRSDFVKRYGLTFQETRQSNDVAFVCTSLALASQICVIDEDLQTHRYNNKMSLQGTNDKQPTCFYEALKELKRRLVKYGVYEEVEPAFLNYVVEVSFYNLMTLKNVFSYEEIYYLIRNEIFENFGISNRPDDYFYAYWRTPEKRNDLISLSSYDFFEKWRGPTNRKPEDMYERTSIDVCQNKGLIESAPKPKISVIMPCLNSMEYLEECLSSVLAQSEKDIEIICVDAGSTDGTVEYIQEEAAKDSRISLLHSDLKSYGYQVNMGMDHACGEFMSIVESDDYIVPDMYEKLYSIAKRYSLEVVKADFSRFYGEKENRTFARASVLKNKKKYNSVRNVRSDPEVFNAYVLITPGLYSLRFLQKNKIRLHESPGAAYQDNGFWFQVLMYAERMWFYPESLYMLRRDNPNSSVKSKGKVYAACKEYDFIRELIGDEPEKVKLFAPYCARQRFYNYKFTLSRIADEYKLDFLVQAAKDFRKCDAAGELHGSLFSDAEWLMLTQIMKDPTRFYLAEYYHANFGEQSHQTKEKGTGKVKSKVKEKVSENGRKSCSENIILQKIRGLLRCIDENGYIYTGKRILEHFGIDMGTPDFKRKNG